MHYYDAFILAGIYVAAALVDIIFTVRAMRAKKETKQGIGIRAIVFVAAVFTVWLAWDTRTVRELSHYENILESNRITVENGAESETVNFSYGDYAMMRDLSEAPIYADEDDYTVICRLEFGKSGKKGGISMRLCRLDNTDGYPSGVYFRYEGEDYCFLSDKFLYWDAFYRLNSDHAMKILETVMARAGV